MARELLEKGLPSDWNLDSLTTATPKSAETDANETGTPTINKFCGQCGTVLAQGVRFCQACGARVFPSIQEHLGVSVQTEVKPSSSTPSGDVGGGFGTLFSFILAGSLAGVGAIAGNTYETYCTGLVGAWRFFSQNQAQWCLILLPAQTFAYILAAVSGLYGLVSLFQSRR